MRIGFDISQTGATKAGCGFYAHALAQRLIGMGKEHEITMLPSFGDFYLDPMMFTASPYSGPMVKYGPRFLDRENARYFWGSHDAEAKLGLDLIHSNNFWCPSNFASTRVIYTLYDLGFTINPAWTTEANRLGCFDGVFRAAIHADWIVSISENSAKEFCDTFPGFPKDRVRIIYPCSRFVGDEVGGKPPKLAKNVERGRFWVSVGTIEPRKNQKMLIRAYADYLIAGGERFPLVLAGGKGWLMDDLVQFIDQLGVSSDVILTGYVTDDELIWLYRNCFANLYPSLYEGFGLPVLEGMQFGAAAIASNSSSLPEVVGDAGVLVSPHHQKGWTDIMLSLSADLIKVNELRQSALLRAKTFDWSKSAAALMELYVSALAEPKRQAFS